MNTSLSNPYDDGSISRGVVYKKTIGNYTVHAAGRVVSCSLSSRLRKQLDGFTVGRDPSHRKERKVKINDDTDPIAVGDEVRFVEAPGETGMIVEVLPRRTRLARRTAVPMPSARPFEQVIVANLDQVVPVFAAASPAPKWNMLDRYLVSAEAAGLPSLICITKLDLAGEDDELEAALDEYRRIGYPLVLTSAVTGQGLDELKQALSGRISVLLGKSGVGKTSLLNALEPGLGLRVNEVSRVSGKGKHTTTHLEMFPLDIGGECAAIVDTPGVREFGLWDVDEDDLALFFPEMRPYLGRCRFGLDCQHDQEPGCAIRRAVSDGAISPRRYHSYIRLKEEAR